MKDLGGENWAFRTIGINIKGSELSDAIGKNCRSWLDVNQPGNKNVNRVLDLDVPLFDDQWAGYPAAMSIRTIQKGYLKGIERENIKIASINNNLKDNIDKAATELKNQDGYEDIMKGMEDVKVDKWRENMIFNQERITKKIPTGKIKTCERILWERTTPRHLINL